MTIMTFDNSWDDDWDDNWNDDFDDEFYYDYFNNINNPQGQTRPMPVLEDSGPAPLLLILMMQVVQITTFAKLFGQVNICK